MLRLEKFARTRFQIKRKMPEIFFILTFGSIFLFFTFFQEHITRLSPTFKSIVKWETLYLLIIVSTSIPNIKLLKKINRYLSIPIILLQPFFDFIFVLLFLLWFPLVLIIGILIFEMSQNYILLNSISFSAMAFISLTIGTILTTLYGKDILLRIQSPIGSELPFYKKLYSTNNIRWVTHLTHFISFGVIIYFNLNGGNLGLPDGLKAAFIGSFGMYTIFDTLMQHSKLKNLKSTLKSWASEVTKG